jgi:hypothetical protein
MIQRALIISVKQDSFGLSQKHITARFALIKTCFDQCVERSYALCLLECTSRSIDLEIAEYRASQLKCHQSLCPLQPFIFHKSLERLNHTSQSTSISLLLATSSPSINLRALISFLVALCAAYLMLLHNLSSGYATIPSIALPVFPTNPAIPLPRPSCGVVQV